jgi:glycerol-3-phosphate dehydrogenase
LSDDRYDMLVIGGGIYGACVAWDATLRGLSVALIDKADFGHATSANSLKIIHGGLRYLQDAKLGLVRRMIRERMVFMRIAPHLVHPLPCVMPTSYRLTRSKLVMAAALLANDLAGFDRNRLRDLQKHLPRGRIISREECLQLLPGIPAENITGGAIWYDCQVYNSERLTLSFVLSAADAGADVANYVEAVGLLRNGDGVTGVKAKDLLTSEELDIRAETVVNAAGPWVESVLHLLDGRRPGRRFHPSMAMNLVARQIIPEYGAGVPSTYKVSDGNAGIGKRSRLLFVVPWRNYSLVGTVHAPCNGDPEDYRVTECEVKSFIDEINAGYPGAALKREDVYFVHRGFLPARDNRRGDQVRLVRQSQVHDHAKEEGIHGLITVVGVKYTTARKVAQQVVDLAFTKLGKKPPECRTHLTPLRGGQIERFDDFLKQQVARCSRHLSTEVARHLIYTYGSEYARLLAYPEQDLALGHRVCDSSAVIGAEVLHGIREEMAQKLTDVIFRRTELGSAGDPGDECLETCAAIMAAELGWNKARVDQELKLGHQWLTSPSFPALAVADVSAFIEKTAQAEGIAGDDGGSNRSGMSTDHLR